jgi:putative ABC transport system substrate-binding protein
MRCLIELMKLVPGAMHGKHRMRLVAPSLGLEATPVNVHDAPEIERAVAAFARSPKWRSHVTGSAWCVLSRGLIVMLAARHKLPAVYARADEVFE